MSLLFLEIFIGFPLSLDKLNTSQENQSNIGLKNQIDIKQGAEQRMEGVHFVESQQGHRDWELFAENAEGHEKEATWKLETIKVLFYSEKSIQFTVFGNKGVVDNRTRDMKIEGNVRVLSSNGYIFMTHSVIYKSKRRVLYSADPVEMKGPGGVSEPVKFVLTGTGIEVDMNKNLIKVLSEVRATQAVDEGQNIKIESGMALFSSVDYYAHFYQNVKIFFDLIEVLAPEAKLTYVSGHNSLHSLHLKGGVQLTDQVKKAVSENMNFNPFEDKWELLGGPVVTEGKDEIQGEKILLLEGGRKVRVERMKAKMQQMEPRR